MLKAVPKLGSIEEKKMYRKETSMHLNIANSKKKRSAMEFKISDLRDMRGNSSPDMNVFDEHHTINQQMINQYDHS
jgi:hypothetical protein